MRVLLRWVGPGFSSSKDKETVELSRVPNVGEYIEFTGRYVGAARTAEVTKVVHFPEVRGKVEHVACCFVGAPQ